MNSDFLTELTLETVNRYLIGGLMLVFIPPILLYFSVLIFLSGRADPDPDDDDQVTGGGLRLLTGWIFVFLGLLTIGTLTYIGLTLLISADQQTLIFVIGGATVAFLLGGGYLYWDD